MGSDWWVLLSQVRLREAKRKAAVTRPGREPLLKRHTSTVNERYRFLLPDQAAFASVLSLLRSGS